MIYWGLASLKGANSEGLVFKLITSFILKNMKEMVSEIPVKDEN
jgi:hypothetical protein